MKYQTILFDLDGTLTDSKEGITRSVQYALSRFGINESNLDVLECFIGPPLGESLSRFYDFSSEDADRAIGYYRERFADHGLYENILYDGLTGLLAQLSSAGVQLAVATTKPTVFALKILEHFELSDFFDVIGGSNLDNTRTAKAEVIQYVLDELGIATGDGADLSSLVMIGDREHDIIGARKIGIDSIGVLYGYGSRQELEESGATFIAKDLKVLGELLL